jgi:2-polyprenyl-6-methoxyphenol hydroxylase-like FAD-dependent oxidoreductase
VTGFAQDATGVDVELSDGQSLRAEYLVGCDGGGSVIRKAAGIEFPGWDPMRSNLIAEVEVTEEPPRGIRTDATGVHALHRMEDGKTDRVVVTEQQLGPSSEPTLRDLSEALITVYGTDFGMHNPTWISRFNDMTRQTATYRARRVLLAGDSAHVHYPAGGQGLSLGVQDAVNLGWKLAQVVNGTSPESLLDTYQDERHPVAPPARFSTRWLRPRSNAGTSASRLWSISCRSWRAWTSLANGLPGSSPGWTFITTSARDIRCSDAVCPIWTS